MAFRTYPGTRPLHGPERSPGRPRPRAVRLRADHSAEKTSVSAMPGNSDKPTCQKVRCATEKGGCAQSSGSRGCYPAAEWSLRGVARRKRSALMGGVRVDSSTYPPPRMSRETNSRCLHGARAYTACERRPRRSAGGNTNSGWTMPVPGRRPWTSDRRGLWSRPGAVCRTSSPRRPAPCRRASRTSRKWCARPGGALRRGSGQDDRRPGHPGGVTSGGRAAAPPHVGRPPWSGRIPDPVQARARRSACVRLCPRRDGDRGAHPTPTRPAACSRKDDTVTALPLEGLLRDAEHPLPDSGVWSPRVDAGAFDDTEGHRDQEDRPRYTTTLRKAPV